MTRFPLRTFALAFVPEHGFDEKTYFLGRNLHDHIAATGHNLSDDGAPMLERAVYYARLRAESVAELEALSNELGMDALQRINRRARELQLADEEHADARQRMSFGVYFYRAAIERQAEDAAETEEAEENGDRAGGSDGR